MLLFDLPRFSPCFSSDLLRILYNHLPVLPTAFATCDVILLLGFLCKLLNSFDCYMCWYLLLQSTAGSLTSSSLSFNGSLRLQLVLHYCHLLDLVYSYSIRIFFDFSSILGYIPISLFDISLLLDTRLNWLAILHASPMLLFLL